MVGLIDDIVQGITLVQMIGLIDDVRLFNE